MLFSEGRRIILRYLDGLQSDNGVIWTGTAKGYELRLHERHFEKETKERMRES